MARDDWQGVDLTTCLEEVARKHHERMLEGLSQHMTPEKQAEIAADESSPYRPWDSLHPVNKQDMKQSLVPIVTDAIDVALTQWAKPMDSLLTTLEEILSKHQAALDNRDHAGVADRAAISDISATVADYRDGKDV